MIPYIVRLDMKALHIQWHDIRRAAGSPKYAYLRSLMLIHVHGHIKVYLKENFVFFPMVPAVEQWLSSNIVKIRVKDRWGVN